MKQVFVSGATGFVGKSLVRRLSETGHRVHAVYRDPEKCGGLALPNVELFRVGGLSDIGGLEQAMKGCETAYHLAAFAAVWVKDPDQIYRQNVEGTRHILDLAVKHGLKRVVFTSTASVVGPSAGRPAREDAPAPEKYFTHYDRSKAKAEAMIQTYLHKGPDVIIVNPSRIYGPGTLSTANSVTRLIRSYDRGRWRWIPGNGESAGNYVYIDDVVEGHILAMERGVHGQRYLLGGSNHSFNDFFRILAGVSGKHYRMIRIPVWLMMMISGFFLFRAKLTGWSPPIIPAYVRRYNHHWMISCRKAEEVLDYHPVPLSEGLQRTLDWIRGQEDEKT